MRFSLVTLGSCRLCDESGQAVPIPAASLHMLAYLKHRQGPVSRRELAELLWPGGAEAALTNLRSMLRRFAGAFPEPGSAPIVIGQSDILLKPDSVLWDLDELASDDPIGRLKALNEAVSRGFFSSERVREGRLAQWIAQIRLALRGELRQALLCLPPLNGEGKGQSEVKIAALLLLEDQPQDEAVRSMLAAASGDIPASSAASPFQRTPAVVKDSLVLPGPQSGHDQDHPSMHSPQPALADYGMLPRLALLPPEPAGDLAASTLTANGLIEDLTIGLCASRSVSVVAPYTAEKIRASDDKVALLRQHNVLYALDTRRSGDWIFAQLIFLPADEVVWATRFPLMATDMLEHRRQISHAIEASIIERVRHDTVPIENFRATPEAYFAYLSGLQSLSQLSLPALRRARRHFRDALRYDRHLASALSGLARTLTLEWVLTARGDSELLYEAERVAKRAIDLDNASAGGFKELGVSQLYQGRIDDSLAALSDAERFSPHYADAIFSHADSLTHASQPGAALEKLHVAMSLNPIVPDAYLWGAAGASYFLQNYEQALSFIDRMQDKQPAARLAAASYGMLGDQVRARLQRNRFLADNPTFDLNRWLAMVPHKEKWQSELYREGLLRAGFKGD